MLCCVVVVVVVVDPLAVAVDGTVAVGEVVQFLICLMLPSCFSIGHRRIHTMQPTKRRPRFQQEVLSLLKLSVRPF